MGCKLDSFLRKSCFSFCFVHIVQLISLEIMQKIYISRFMLQGRNIIFRSILRVRCSLRKIKQHLMLIFSSESRGNAVKKAKRLRMVKVDVLTVQRELLVFQCCHSSEVSNLNTSLNIKKKSCKEFLVPYNINNQLQ